MNLMNVISEYPAIYDRKSKDFKHNNKKGQFLEGSGVQSQIGGLQRTQSERRFSRHFSRCYEMRLGKAITHMENRIANTIAKVKVFAIGPSQTICDVVTCIWKPGLRVVIFPSHAGAACHLQPLTGSRVKK